MDCWLDPHWRSTVTPGTVSGQPAVNSAVRPMSRACSPACITQPQMTSSTIPGSMPALVASPLSTCADSSAGCTPESPPLRLPTGERTASTMTASGMVMSPLTGSCLDCQPRGWATGWRGGPGPDQRLANQAPFAEPEVCSPQDEERGDNGRVKRLNGMDAMLLYSETPNMHTHTLKVAIIDPSGGDADFSFDDFRRHLRRRLHLLEPLRYKLVDIPWRLHHPMWLENCDVDLDYHLRRVQVPAPGGGRELDAVIGEVASTPLDRSRPLWEFHFAEGLAGGRFALIGKIHHALADGVASVNLLARAMDLTDGP